jgi:hypothetical protein
MHLVFEVQDGQDLASDEVVQLLVVVRENEALAQPNRARYSLDNLVLDNKGVFVPLFLVVLSRPNGLLDKFEVEKSIVKHQSD